MRNQLKNQQLVSYKSILKNIEEIETNDKENIAIPNVDGKEEIGTNLYLIYNDNGIQVTYDTFNRMFYINGKITTDNRFEIFEILINKDNYYMNTEYISGSMSDKIYFLSGDDQAIEYGFNGNEIFILENIKYIVFQFENKKGISFDNYMFKLNLSSFLYTGELVNKYSEIKEIRVVVSFQKGKVYNEQFGLMYEYGASLQHTGPSVLKEGDLVWLQTSTSNSADYIVKGVIPSLNSTLCHLVKKEA